MGVDVRAYALKRIVSSVYDATLAPELWPTALQSVTEAINTVGTAYIIRDKRTE